ncbi:hypothetical protein SELMODRAFT_408686 [Selaginella moellendorffii]|uniref:Pectinesterase inhibitor domain-containing protein n=1 Tax=Selaginella moellendorffii TaxID=88036 RepID=D8R9M3_SELML|nr:hypothetical protein SELMODRAFT_408686 [Selaginella moellendorffii]
MSALALICCAILLAAPALSHDVDTLAMQSLEKQIKGVLSSGNTTPADAILRKCMSAASAAGLSDDDQAAVGAISKIVDAAEDILQQALNAVPDAHHNCVFG